MDNVLAALVLVLFAVWLVGRIARAVESFKGHRYCAYCWARLHSAGAKWADTCWSCRQVQPWAEKREVV